MEQYSTPLKQNKKQLETKLFFFLQLVMIEVSSGHMFLGNAEEDIAANRQWKTNPVDDEQDKCA